MKSCLPFLLGLFLSFSYLHAGAYTATEEDYARCYVVDLEAQTVTFVFNPQYWTIYAAPPIYVKGTFNNWANSTYFSMSRDEQGNFSATFPLSQLRQPGVSGRAEFNIIIGASPLYPSAYRRDISSIEFPYDYIFHDGNTHFMLILTPEDFEKAKEDNLKMSTLKTLADFDLTTREGREEISNFRKVPGTKNLFRSYHPIKYSFPQYDTEQPRHQVLSELCVEEGIRSDINLSGASSLVPATVTLYNGEKYTEETPDFYRAIMEAGRILNVTNANYSTPTSEDVYYQHWINSYPPQINTDLSTRHICTMLQQIVQYINSEESLPPYLIHCHVGQDRTGVMCALLSALCGASWEEIAQDYEKTQRLGNRDFKGLGLLKYSLECFLGIDPYAPPANSPRSTQISSYSDTPSDIENADSPSDDENSDNSDSSDSSDNPENSSEGDSSDSSDSSENSSDDENSDSSDSSSSSLPLGIEKVEDIGAAVRKVLTDNNYLTADELSALTSNLNPVIASGVEPVISSPDNSNYSPADPPLYYDLSGRAIPTPTLPGIYLRVVAGKVTKLAIR